MVQLVVDPSTAEFIREYGVRLPQGVVLSGDEGVGLMTIASELHPNIEHIIVPTDPKGAVDHMRGTIGIETIRDLYTLTRGRAARPVGIIIDDADKMTIPAQQAFLKLLEEPPSAVNFILTAHHVEALLPTIRSRVGLRRVPRVSRADSLRLIERYGFDWETTAQLMFLADGRPAELHRLAEDEAYRISTIEHVRRARAFLQGTLYERVAIAASSTDRSAALALITMSLMILRHTLQTTLDTTATAQVDALMAAHDAISANANPRLQLLVTVL